MGIISYRNRSKGKVDKNGRACRPSWEYRFSGPQIRGKRTCFSKAGFPTKRDAVLAGTKAYNEYMVNGTVFVESNMSYSDVLDSWMDNYVRISCAAMTIEGYELMLQNHIRPVFGRYRLAAIKHEAIQRFINQKYDDGYSRNTLVNLLGVLSCSLRYAKRQRWIQNNPAEDIDLPKVRACVNQRGKTREPIPRDVIQKIFKRFPEGSSAHLPLMLAYHCGMRLGEVFGLTWDNIDLETGTLLVNGQMQWRKEPGKWQIQQPKYGSSRRIALDKIMLDLLIRTREQQLERRKHYGELYVRNYIDNLGYLNRDAEGEEIDLVLLREDGTYVQSTVIEHASKVIKSELGYRRFDFHSLRHTHATELSEFGVNVKEIQRRLGHKTLDVTTRTYLHATALMEADSKRIMNQMYSESANA